MLCPGLKVSLQIEDSGEEEVWQYTGGLADYLDEALGDAECVPDKPFVGSADGGSESADWALVWLPDGGGTVGESYVNLIPTPQGGTHVNGLRIGSDRGAARVLRISQPVAARGADHARGRLGPVSFVLSVKMEDPQFSGQTKERLSSRECAAFVSGVVKDVSRCG